jgi:YD repeat-containing protein
MIQPTKGDGRKGNGRRFRCTASASLTYAYDLADRITQITYPSGRVVRYGYDAKGRVSNVETRSSAAAAWVNLASNMSYQASVHYWDTDIR